MLAEEQFAELCQHIVEVTYAAVGSRLTDEEIVELATELAISIMLTFQAASNPVPEMAGEAMEEFFLRRGITDVGDGWRWMN